MKVSPCSNNQSNHVCVQVYCSVLEDRKFVLVVFFLLFLFLGKHVQTIVFLFLFYQYVMILLVTLSVSEKCYTVILCIHIFPSFHLSTWLRILFLRLCAGTVVRCTATPAPTSLLRSPPSTSWSPSGCVPAATTTFTAPDPALPPMTAASPSELTEGHRQWCFNRCQPSWCWQYYILPEDSDVYCLRVFTDSQPARLFLAAVLKSFMAAGFDECDKIWVVILNWWGCVLRPLPGCHLLTGLTSRKDGLKRSRKNNPPAFSQLVCVRWQSLCLGCREIKWTLNYFGCLKNKLCPSVQTLLLSLSSCSADWKIVLSAKEGFDVIPPFIIY
jgi:hypothetical protein